MLAGLAAPTLMPTSALAVTVSGFAYADEQATPAVWSQCDGVSANISMSFDGGAKASVPCDGSTGAFTFTTTFGAADRVLAVYLDPTTSGDQGVLYTRNADTTSNVTGLRVTKGRVWLRSESGTTIDNSAIDRFDSSQDADIPASSSGIDLSLAPGMELHLGAGTTFLAGGNVTAPALHVTSTGRYVGHSLETLTITGSGTGAACDAGPGTMRPLCIDTGGKLLLVGNQRTRYTGTAALDVQSATYRRLELAPAGPGSPTMQLGAGGAATSATRLHIGDGTNPVTASTTGFNPTLSVYGDLTVDADATLSGAGTGTITATGSVAGAGTISLTAGLFNHRVAAMHAQLGSSSGTAAWSFYDLMASDHAGTAWGSGGVITYNSGGTNDDRIDAMTRDADGNLYVGGYHQGSGKDYAVRRYTPAGTLDTGWGSSGMVTYNSGSTYDDRVYELEVDPRGYLYVGGELKAGDPTGPDWGILRYTPTGALDTSWGSSGIVTYSSGVNQTDMLNQIEIDAQGRLYGGGFQQSNGRDFVVRRYTATGALDTGWGSSGMVTWNSGGTQEDTLTTLKLSPDGSLYVGGYAVLNGHDMVVRRYTPSGTLDTAWGSSGMVTYNSSGTASDIVGIGGLALDDAGNLYAGGYVGTNSTDLAVRRYTPSGTLDTSWGLSGMVTYNSGGGQDSTYQIDIDAAGRLIATGYQQTNGFDWVLLRYTQSGTLDSTFGGGTGYLTYNTGATTTDSGRRVLVDEQGSLYVAGYAAINGYDWMVRKYDDGGNLVDGTAGTAPTSRAAGGGMGAINVAGTLSVGSASDAATTTLDLETNDRTLDVDGNLSISSRGSLTASSSAPFTLGGNFTSAGTFTPGTGTVTLDDAAKVSVLDYAAPFSFYGLTVNTAGKTVRFDDVNDTTVTGALTVTGASCTSHVLLRSQIDGSAFSLNVTGSASITYADVRDSAAVTPISASGSADSGGNTGWTFLSCPPQPPVSLAQFESDGVTAIATGANTTSGGAVPAKLTFDVSDQDASQTLTPWVEVRPSGAAFSAACGASIAGVTFSGASVSAPTASTAYGASVDVSGLADGGYHWRACAVDQSGAAGSWTARGSDPDFVVYNADPPWTPVHVSPSDTAWVTSRTPLLTATFSDPDPTDTGTVEFELCSTAAAEPWSSNCGAGYRTGTSRTGITNGANGSWAPNVDLADGTWYWRARAIDPVPLLSGWSAPWSVRVDATPPTRPPNVRVTQNGQGSIVIAWDASTDAGSGLAHYDVETSSDGVTWTVQCNDTTLLTCSQGGLGNNARIFFRVRAFDVAGNASLWAYIDETTLQAYYLRTSVNSAHLPLPNRQASLPPVAIGNTSTTAAHEKTLGWYVFSPGSSNGTAAAGQPSTAPIAGGTGWVIDDVAGRTVAAGDLHAKIDLASTHANGTGQLHCRFWRITTDGTNITSSSHLGTASPPEDIVTGGAYTQRCDLPSAIPTQSTFAANEAIYVELWLQLTASGGGPGGQSTSIVAEDGSSWIEMRKAGLPPDVPTLVSPADAAIVPVQTELRATYTHPSGVAGVVLFEVATDSAFTSIVDSGMTPVLASGETGGYEVQGLQPGTVYYWRAQAEDNEARMASGWSATRTFTVTSAPAQPTNVSPAAGATGIAISPTLSSSAFSDVNAGDSHAASQWQVRTETGSYVNAVADSGETVASLTSWTVSPALQASATYWWRVRHRDSFGQWSTWSVETSFSTVADASTTISVDAASIDFGILATGADSTATSVVTITTTDVDGYTLTATDESDTWGTDCTCGGQIPDWTGSDTTPTTWAAGTAGYFGLTVRDTTGSVDDRLAKWGSANSTGWPETDFTNNLFAGLDSIATTTLHQTAAATAGDTITTSFRTNPAAGTPAGSYAATITYTVTANP